MSNDLHEITWDEDKKEEKSGNAMVDGSKPLSNDPREMIWNEAPAPMKYAVKVNGNIVSKPFSNNVLAEQHIATLAEEMKEGAVVVQVDDSGKELLLG